MEFIIKMPYSGMLNWLNVCAVSKLPRLISINACVIPQRKQFDWFNFDGQIGVFCKIKSELIKNGVTNTIIISVDIIPHAINRLEIVFFVLN